MKYTKVEEYTITLTFKELRNLKQLVRCAVMCITEKEDAPKWVELEPDEIELAGRIVAI